MSDTENNGGQAELTELDRIALTASHDEAAADAAEQAALHPELERIDPADTWAELPRMLGSLLCMAMPELRDVYTEPACYRWGAGMAAVAEKRGWDAARVIGPELALFAATVPLAIPTFFAIKARRDDARQRAQEKTIQPEPAPAAGPMAMEPGGFSVPA